MGSLAVFLKWQSFAAYVLVVAVLFFIFFKHKHDPKALENV